MTADGYTLHHGSDGHVDFLLRTWPDGQVELMTRPAGSCATWAPPVSMTVETAVA